MAKIAAEVRRLLQHPRLPLILALAAIVFMLPALPTGLFGDDLIQRPKQFTAEQLPPRLLDTGFVPHDSGKLGTVLNGLFGYNATESMAAHAKDYGIAPWWAHEGWTAALWRPLTAFTHWLDYRFFPNSPMLMHGHNIAWYAVAVFLVATLYRKIALTGVASARGAQPPVSGESNLAEARLLAAGLAGCLYLLDKNTFFPVLYVANRGFIVALVFGLLCLEAHVRWRSTKRRWWMFCSAFWLLLSLLANEGGASTLAFLIAYALVLENGAWAARLASLIPAALVVLGWRAVYVGLGFGVRNFVGYLDPGYEPLLFLEKSVPRINAILGGQLTGIPPELSFALSSKSQVLLGVGFAGFTAICALLFAPTLRRDPVARYWAVAMLLATVPAATVAPLTKNLAFVAVGAFGLIASFLVGYGARPHRAVLPVARRFVAGCVVIWLLVAHIPAAIAGRSLLALASSYVPRVAAEACSFGNALQIGGRDVVVINDPTLLSMVVPFDQAYRSNSLPASLRVLVPGSLPIAVKRTGSSSLLLTARGTDLFDCPPAGPVHPSYLCKAINEFLFGAMTWNAGDRVRRHGFMAEVRETSARGAPRVIAFEFDRPLDSDQFVWVFFDWSSRAHLPFVLPQPGETIEIDGAWRRGL